MLNCSLVENVNSNKKNIITQISVDYYEKDVLKGYMYTLDGSVITEIDFVSTMDFLKKIERIVNQVKIGNSSDKKRKFQVNAETDFSCEVTESTRKGRIGTFYVDIMFCQHTSWQGCVSWIEGRKKAHFRSALELLFLMDSAVKKRTT